MKRLTTLLVAFGSIFILFVTTLGAQQHTKDSLDLVKKNLEDKKAVLIDVRESSEWEAGHLKDAKLLPLSTIKKSKDHADEAFKVLPKDQIIYLHCAAGVRCVTAAGVLEKLGFDVRPIKEGYKDLLKAGFVQAEK